MITFSSAALLYVVGASFVLNECFAQSISANTNMSCAPDETECPLGCCPYADAECCADGFECCPHGETCIPVVGICLALQDQENGKQSLVSKKATPIRNKVTACPSGTTPCGDYMCCPLPNAVCCSDLIHCCPNGYTCDVEHGQCLRFSNEISKDKGPSGVIISDQFKTINKPSYKSCPGGIRQCPSYMSCCLNDYEIWSCCPNPSQDMFRRGNSGECCDTVFGHMCCPDDLPTCTVVGCMK